MKNLWSTTKEFYPFFDLSEKSCHLFMLRCDLAKYNNCKKSARIWSYSDPCSVRMQQNTDQNNSEHGHFLRGEHQILVLSQDVKCSRIYNGIYEKIVAKLRNSIFIIKFKI